MNTGSPSFMRRMNKRIVFDIIKQKKVISKPELCEITNLKPPTMNSIVDNLLADGLIVCVGKGESNSQGGPRPNLYSLNGKGRYFIGLDINGKGILGVIMSINSEIAATAQRQDVAYRDQEHLTQLILEIVNELLAKAGVGMEKLGRVGISVAALVNIERGIIVSVPESLFNNYAIIEALSPHIKAGIYVDNDINMIALGQRLLVDELRKLNNVVCIGIRDGMGLSIIIDGKVYRGKDGLSGNVQGISHAESEHAMLERVRAYLKANRGRMEHYAGLDIDRMTVQDMYEAVKNDEEIAGVVNESFVQIGQLAAMMEQLLGPDGIIFAGEIFNYNKMFFKTIVEASQMSPTFKPMPQTDFYEVPLARNTIACCAALNTINEFYRLDNIIS